MGLKKFEKDMNIIVALDDEPNDVGGLSASQLKEKFDQSGCEIKQYINETLLPALEAESAAASLGVRMPSSSGSEGPGTIQEAIDSLSAVAMNGGAVPSGGAAGQILAKSDGEDHRLKWIDADAEAFGSYPKEKILSATTKTLFGLGEDAVPDDALAFLGKYNQHWWRSTAKEIIGATYNISDVETDVTIGIQNSIATVQYSDTIDVSSGVVALAAPITSIEVNAGDAESLAQLDSIKGKFFRTSFANSDAIYQRAQTDSYVSQNGRFIYGYASGKLVSYVPATSIIGDTNYLHSAHRNAYPDSGITSGIEYEYLGIPFGNAVTAPKIEAGSYVGTGTYGQSNPTTLEFDAPPLMVFVVGDRSFFAIRGSSEANVIYSGSGGRLSLIWSGNSLSWYVYAEPDAYNQLNIEGKAYYYIAILI